MKSPAMPSNLPPLPMGKNGKPLVYLGQGRTFKRSTMRYECYWARGEKWDNDDGSFWDGGHSPNHYAAESDSEICHLNGWGDFEEPDVPQTMLQRWQEAAQKALDESEARFAALSTAIAAESVHMRECRDTRNALTADPDRALQAKAWFDHGKQVERSHGKNPTTFPLWPQDVASTKTTKE